MKKYYGVMGIKKELTVEVLGLEQKTPLIWAKGMCGAIPVFAKREDALAYMNKGEDCLFEVYVEDVVETKKDKL